MSGRRTDSFVSHAGRDTGWAEWLAWQLHDTGYSVELDVWDSAPGEDFVARMQTALERADRLLAVCTEAYFSSAFGGAELRAAFVRQAVGRRRPPGGLRRRPLRPPPRAQHGRTRLLPGRTVAGTGHPLRQVRPQPRRGA